MIWVAAMVGFLNGFGVGVLFTILLIHIRRP